MSAASLNEEKESEIIVKQVRVIDDLITQLDHGWVESENVRSFLLKHYGHGKRSDDMLFSIIFNIQINEVYFRKDL